MKKKYVRPTVTLTMLADAQLVCWSGGISGSVGGPVGLRRRVLVNEEEENIYYESEL